MPQKIYLADDEKNIRDLIAAFLSQEGFEVKAFESGDALLSACDTALPDLVIFGHYDAGYGRIKRLLCAS